MGFSLHNAVFFFDSIDINLWRSINY